MVMCLVDGYMLVTCCLCDNKKLKFNYIMIEGQSFTVSFSDKELFLFNFLFIHHTDKFRSEYEA